jgi:hypothetical protein
MPALRYSPCRGQKKEEKENEERRRSVKRML